MKVFKFLGVPNNYLTQEFSWLFVSFRILSYRLNSIELAYELSKFSRIILSSESMQKILSMPFVFPISHASTPQFIYETSIAKIVEILIFIDLD